jgi:Pentapeptide repeats (8 copies)
VTRPPALIGLLVLTLLAASPVTPAVAAAPASAQGALSRRLIDQCVGCRLPKDLRGRDLRDARFAGVSVHGTSFARAKLDGVKLSGVDFDGHGSVAVHRSVRERRYVWIEDGDVAIPPLPPLPAVPSAPWVPPVPPTPPDQHETP